MSMYAPSRTASPVGGESNQAQLSDEERDKLQEIHELINLIIRDMPVMSQITTQHYALPQHMLTIPAVPYTYSVLPLPWGGIQYVAPRMI
ncbi:MAG TPA: hypothetical protein VKM94_23300 [Blastocatellia bacterium]|nr:hypothetical protein [Blastocatellia bacterium]